MPPETLIGRDQDLSHLLHLVRTCRMTTIVGPGGIGKTTVARKLMQQVLGQFQETHFVDLSGALATDDLARFLGASLRRPALGRSLGLSADAYSGRRVLIVLDTCEHLVEQVAALTDWLLMTAPESHVLLTSRQALRSSQEAVYVLPSPDTPRERHDLSSSQQIFMASAEAGGLRLEPTADDRCLIESICCRLDGNPLAIGIVARRVATHGLQRTSGLIDNPWWLMTQALNGQQQRHRSIGAMIGWSYDLLDEVERCVLDQVSGMDEGFTVAQAETGTSSRAISPGAVALALSRLLEHSLIAATADQAEAAFRVPNLIKLFVRSKSAH
jgi:predicted ATPase